MKTIPYGCTHYQNDMGTLTLTLPHEDNTNTHLNSPVSSVNVTVKINI